ncbi:BC1881 family protein [Bacillus thuringiensis]|uniref:BC1881 family protein n=1 Tax=Bacillus thuringiensis TaxID=1428 RepID=UPI001FAE0191|nr:BC1881 family protein [Bacillus thuringiensis]MDM8365959.1 BC1881 family protein [Bacillus thuringiensis]
MNLKNISTKDMSEELEKRDEVTSIHVEPHVKVEVAGAVVEGPAIILINQD